VFWLSCGNINFFSILAQFSIVLSSILHLSYVDYELWKEFVEFIEFVEFNGLKRQSRAEKSGERQRRQNWTVMTDNWKVSFRTSGVI